MLPRVHSAAPEVVFLNTAGGLTGGDRMQFSLSLEAGARATATTQTAERAYAAAGGEAELDVDLSLGAGASLDWLPQETILFENSALRRRTTAALAGEARLLMVETVVLGRQAMGERLDNITFSDLRYVTRDGKPELIEPLRLTAETLALRAAPAGLDHARAFATVALLARGAEDAKTALRGVFDAQDLRVAVSGWNGKCLVRLLARDPAALRRALAAALTTLRQAPLPRVWQI